MKTLNMLLKYVFFFFLIIDSLSVHDLLECYLIMLTLLFCYILLNSWYPINFHSYLNLISRNMFQGLECYCLMGTFLIGNITFGLRFGFQRHAFPNKGSFFKVLFFFILFSLKKNDNSNFYKNKFFIKKRVSLLSGDACEKCGVDIGWVKIYLFIIFLRWYWMYL